MPGLNDSDVLNEELFIKIASEINGVTPEQLSDYLGFKGSQASNAKKLCPAKLKSPYEILLGIFVSIPGHGKGTESAKKLRLIFLLNDMVPCVELVENALRSCGRKFPSRADTLSGLPSNPPSPPHHTPELMKAVIVNPSRADTPTCQDVNPPSPTHDKPELEKAGIVNPSRADTPTGQDVNSPSPPHDKPELEKTGIVIPSPADTLTGQDVNPPFPPHDKPGSETPVTPTPRGLKPLGHPEELQQQPPSISRGIISDTVNSQALDLPSSSLVKPGSETPFAPTPSEPNRQTRQPHGHGLQPPDRQVQQPTSISRGMQTVVTVFVAIIAIYVYNYYIS